MSIRSIAFYLPQFHPIPENDAWWGPGFTEWTNVAKAKPLFKGHFQPRLPADLGYYDLRVPEVRKAQADMAKKYNIHAFCYWHYWFGNGKRILERPFNEVLTSGEPDFPFCLAWANDSWSGIWHGNPKSILVEQTYPGKKDYEDHFNSLLPAFLDKRYVRVNDKPLFMVFMPQSIPDLPLFVNTFQDLAKKNGLAGIHLVATNVLPTWDSKKHGFDAISMSNHSKLEYIKSDSKITNFYRRIKNHKKVSPLYKKILKRPTHIYDYAEAAKHFVNDEIIDDINYPTVIPNWDNSARSGLNGFVLHNSTPELFKKVLIEAKEKVSNYDEENKIIFIKAWNEWAEGNYLEPDRKFGYQYLDAVKEVLG